MIEDVLITPLDIIKTSGGKVMHAMKKSHSGYMGFGEAYFSQVAEGAVRAWKRHKNMTLNLVVPLGKIKFVLFDNRGEAKAQFQEIVLSESNYVRLTIPPGIWFGFQGLAIGKSMLLNIANVEHDPHEVENKGIEYIEFNWGD